jgi:hypothetical protein
LERLKEFSETDLVNFSQGLVSISSAITSDSKKLKEVYDRNSDAIELYRLPPLEDATTKVFNIFWQSDICGQIILQIKNQTGVISYWVDALLSNKNIATDAVNLLTKHAFDAFNIYTIEAYVRPENSKSLRVLEKSGFHQTELLFTTTGVEHRIYRLRKGRHTDGQEMA